MPKDETEYMPFASCPAVPFLQQTVNSIDLNALLDREMPALQNLGTMLHGKHYIRDRETKPNRNNEMYHPDRLHDQEVSSKFATPHCTKTQNIKLKTAIKTHGSSTCLGEMVVHTQQCHNPKMHYNQDIERENQGFSGRDPSMTTRQNEANLNYLQTSHQFTAGQLGELLSQDPQRNINPYEQQQAFFVGDHQRLDGDPGSPTKTTSSAFYAQRPQPFYQFQQAGQKQMNQYSLTPGGTREQEDSLPPFSSFFQDGQGNSALTSI